MSADLVVFSHLRWDWVWQRPQHLVTRLAASRRRTWWVEQVEVGDVATPELRTEQAGPVVRVRPLAPAGSDEAWLATALQELVAPGRPDVWLYDPMALDVAEALQPRVLAYDVMDDLAAFADAAAPMAIRMREALLRADVVFAGGRSLHRQAVGVRGEAGTHLFPSGVECLHYAQSREVRRPHERPVAGYVGVLDERLDLQLVADLAAALPDWDVHLVGPTTKIDPATLPAAPNIRYPGMQTYEQLPAVMAGFDVALMPFALNDATRSISPTKTLEYLAAGLPVVSTRVADVVADWSDVVRFADDGAAFAAACRAVRDDSQAARDARVEPLRRRHEWDAIAAEMNALLEAAASPLDDGAFDDGAFIAEVPV